MAISSAVKNNETSVTVIAVTVVCISVTVVVVFSAIHVGKRLLLLLPLLLLGLNPNTCGR